MRGMSDAVVGVRSRLLPYTRALHFLVVTALHFSIGIHTGVYAGLIVVAVGSCLAGGLLAVRTVLAVDPATVFRG